mmetsp:Transcript_23437/g.50821  ORF Transcript_23437/g.50821 Transcript_23437/m.50821 type:complete len:99 (+) Transcript_23437:64-360(+)
MQGTMIVLRDLDVVAICTITAAAIFVSSNNTNTHANPQLRGPPDPAVIANRKADEFVPAYLRRLFFRRNDAQELVKLSFCRESDRRLGKDVIVRFCFQ